MASAKKPHHRRETFNQIVLMLILAFSLRVFVVEAFVIPTGSMAPTLKGAHCRFICENCSYAFDTNYSSRTNSATEINIPRVAQELAGGVVRPQAFKVFCPNCGFEIGERQSVGPRVYYGDRILVLKYAYMLQAPKRWDVVVFKTPADPKVHHYSQAYIKRLIGTPGEQVMILDGDIYAAPAQATSDLDWKIQTKPPVVQDALWRIVHDSDYAPQGLTPESKSAYETATIESYIPWKSPDKSWTYTRDTTGAVCFNFGDLKSVGTLTFDRSVGRDKASLSDWLAYDQVPPPGQSPIHPVSDVKLSLFYSRLGGSGSLELRISKRNDLFIASVDATSASLFRSRPDAPEERKLVSKVQYPFGAKPSRLDFQNVDYRVSLNVDGHEVLSTTPQEYSPEVTSLKGEYSLPPYPSVSISASKHVCSITHLSLWRDVYYTTMLRGGARVLRGSWDNPVKLGPDEYFTLGDNSPLSQDGRFWEDPVRLPLEEIDAQAGVVPSRFMLGKALLVYWPAGFRLYHPSAPDLIPNFGELRFIH